MRFYETGIKAVLFIKDLRGEFLEERELTYTSFIKGLNS